MYCKNCGSRSKGGDSFKPCVWCDIELEFRVDAKDEPNPPIVEKDNLLTCLKVGGVLAVIIGIIVGIANVLVAHQPDRPILPFMAPIVIGIFASLVQFGLARIISNQKIILLKMRKAENKTNRR